MTSDDHRIVQQIKKALGSDMPVKTIGGLSPRKIPVSGVQAARPKAEKVAAVAAKGNQRRGRSKSFDFGL
jgi:hypothetical protein